MPAYDLSRAVWRKSARSGANGNCVEVAVVPRWRKSSRSGQNGNCVEVAALPGADRMIAVRDSKDPDGPKLFFAPAAWASFLGTLRRDQYDL